MVTLVVKKGAEPGARFEVTSELVLGRENADVTLNDDQVSRRHAVVRPTDDGVEVEDLGSTNGTFVDEVRIAAATRVAPGGTVRVGNVTLSVERESATTVASAVRETSVAPSPTVAPPATPPPTPAPTPPPAAAPPPAPAPVPAPPPAPGPPPAPVGAPAVVAPPPASFAPPQPTRLRKAATRQVKATILTYTAIIVTAVALIIYFAVRAFG